MKVHIISENLQMELPSRRSHLNQLQILPMQRFLPKGRYFDYALGKKNC